MTNAAPRLPIASLLHWEQTRRDAPYLIQPTGQGQTLSLTWGQTIDMSRRLAAHLAEAYPEGSRIALLGKNTAWWFISDFAIWMAGHVSVPIYPNLVGSSVRQILDHCEASALILGKLDDWDSVRSGIPENLPVIRMPSAPVLDGTDWDQIQRASAPMNPVGERNGDELATLVYTSGTTGTPKGVMHSFANMANAGAVLVEMTDATAEDRLLSYLPAAHVADRLFSQMLSVNTGCAVYFSEGLETFAQDLLRARPTIFLSVPRLWLKFQSAIFAKKPPQKLERLFRIPVLNRIVKRKILTALGLDSVRMAMSGTAPLPESVLGWYRTLGLELLEGYGMTENFAISHSSRPRRARLGYVGECQTGVTMRFGETGEILVKSPCVTQGYYKDPEKTAELLTEDGFIRTGDVGELDDQGRLRLTGRIKEQFKTSKGKYVAPAPIENRLCEHPMVEASLVTGPGYAQPFALLMLPAGEWKKHESSAVRESLTASLDALRLQINEKLDPHERLDFLVVVREQWTVECGFLTPTLKLKRAAMESHYGTRFDNWARQRKGVVWEGA